MEVELSALKTVWENALAFQMILEEVKRLNPNVVDLYYSESDGVWFAKYDNLDIVEYAKFEDFICTFL